MIGIEGARARTRRATRWVKSGLSMMTTASGRAAIIASAVSRMRRKIIGRRRGMALTPIMARSSIGKGLAIPAAAMARPPTPARLKRPTAGHERPRKRRPQRVAGFLPCNEVDRQRTRPRRAVHADFSSGTPTKKIFAKSAAAVSRAGSATIVAPAVTASPARPARATFSTVCGPMAGRSKRRS